VSSMSAIDEVQETSSRKRKLEDDDSNREEAKRKQLKAESEVDQPQLLDLAEEILMEILMKLDGESLHNLGL
jgi:hypothetical protein